uniref:Uncharacterized protein n=1 Tax=Rhizophagus irregularis (strain DAOM 181602 / DAOM 197198 / MUCL 43194) TaxID=747089 RepID=U9UHE2_RHIID
MIESANIPEFIPGQTYTRLGEAEFTNKRESKISQDSKKNLQRAFGAEGRIKDLNSQIRSLKYQINSHNCNYVLNKINYKK